jgi:23S rRNA (cytidine2498-2'-O)-methyltransferase
VLDCVLVEPQEWWIGYHAVHGPESCWPGGVPAIELPQRAVSRAYLKMEEALRWSELPIRSGDHCVEIGCAPGGASQALLDHGLKVLGIDPAEVDPRLLAEAGFTHLQMRGADVRRRVFRNTRWLTADVNVAPQYTLDTVEAIVIHPAVHVQGMLLTLKLSDWRLADELPNYLDRVRQWGFKRVRARQLAFNRQEVCVAASRDMPRRSHARQSAAKRHVPARLAVRRRLNL